VPGRLQCTLAAQQPTSGEDTMTKQEAVKESPKEIFLKDYKAPDYAFEKVQLLLLSVFFVSAVSCVRAGIDIHIAVQGFLPILRS
jgi:hypothetical protein